MAEPSFPCQGVWETGGIFILEKTTQTHIRVRQLAVLGILAAASIILGKFLQIRVGDTIRISLENLPIIFAGIVFGPISGAAVGIVADLVGCVAVGYAINPIITAGAAIVGLTAGLCGMISKGELRRSFPAILLPVAVAHIIGSMIAKTVGLHIAFGTPWSALISTRVPIYLVNIAVESVLIYILLKSEAIRASLKGFIK